jgi:membrane fusion protein
MLFRLEAIEHHRGGICGEMTLPVPVPVSLTTVFLAVCLTVSAGFVATGTYTRKEHVSGFLAPEPGVVRIVPQREGMIAAVHVHEGDLVRPGDALVTVSAGRANDRGEDVDQAMLGRLKQQAAVLRTQIALEQRRADRMRASADEAIAGVAKVIAALQAEQSIQTQRTAIALRDLQASADLLARAEMSPLEGRRRQDAYLAQRAAESAMARAILDKQAEVSRLRGEAADVGPASAQRLAVLEGSAAEIEGRMAELDGQHAALLTAPVRGRVSALQAFVGKEADPAVPLMSIVPEGGVLQAQLLVPARAIGLVRAGQRVRLSYDAFPYQLYGFAEGVVASVARSSLKPGEFSGPVELDAPAFRVTVALARQSLRVAGAEVPLQSDTRLQADILQETTSLLGWLINPLRDAGGRI